MDLICGIDFSEASSRAANVAAQLAGRLNARLHLVHSAPDWPTEASDSERAGLMAATTRAMEAAATRLRGRGADVAIHVELEPPEVALPRVAKAVSASMLIVGATGRGRAGGQAVGRTADRLVQQSSLPTLLVHADGPFQQWMANERPLKILIGLELSTTSDEAWRWVQKLAAVGPISAMGAHVYWPPSEFQRLGLGGMRSYVEPDPEVDRVLRRELQARFVPEAKVSVELRLEPGIGRPADHLLQIARDFNADLVVCGAHQRAGVGRLWEASVSRGILHGARQSVACVPSARPREQEVGGRYRLALAATDFSSVGDAAIRHAYRLVGAGGRVALLHVIPAAGRRSDFEPTDIFAPSVASKEVRRAAEEKLRALVPARDELGERVTEVLVAESSDPADAISQAAERIGADAICLGTHGRTGVAKAVLGSVAQSVLSRTRRPVLLVRAKG